jgi:hypothetical protein
MAGTQAVGSLLESLLALRTSGSLSLGACAPTPLVAAIDQGTQSTRVYLFNKNQQPVASHQVPLPQVHPQPG